MQAQPCHLGGLGVLVTRPAHQADALCELIERAHGRPIRFPALEITPSADAEAARAILAAPNDLLVFVSANAAEHGFALLPDSLPAALDIAAVGRATAAKLEALGLEPTLVPETGFDSEALLELPELAAPHGRRVVIVRGNDGRSLLGDTLRERGAEVAYAEVYRRGIPRRSPDNLLRGWARMVDVVTASSNAVLDNLFTMLGDDGAERVRNTPLVVVSRRMADHARELRCRDLHLAASAHDTDVLAALCALRSGYG